MSRSQKPLTPEERAVYEWQIWIPGFSEDGQKALKNSSALVTRIGGVGGAAAYYLAAAGIGRLVLAHHGKVRPSDLNRQILMTADSVGKQRVDSARRRLLELNPRLEVQAIGENISNDNVSSLVESVDIVIDAAPLFQERFLLNRETQRLRKPMIECSMYEMEAQLTSIVPGKTPCLACLYPSDPPGWKRQFPVMGAVTGAIGSMGALEAIKVLCGLGEPLLGRLLIADLREMTFRTVKLSRNPRCFVCG